MKEQRVPSSAGERKLAVPAEPAHLFGRERELARISGLLEQAAARGGSLLIRGEPGIGKSALLGEAKKRAEKLGVLVLTTAGAPFEAQMPFAALHRLLRPLASGIDALPKRQREALLVAFGVGDGPAPDVYLIALAALQVLADRAGQAPLLLVVEDAHWLDASSCEVLAFVARRLEMEPIIALFAARDDAASHISEAGLPVLTLRALDDASANALLTVSAPELRPEIRRRVLDEADGNPLALIELPRALDSGRFALLPATAPLPLTERLERAFAVRVSGLPSATRLMLLVAALDEAADLREILAATSLIGDREASIDDVAPAAAAGLVSVSGQTMRFRHPLVRAAIYHAAPVSERQAAHIALAEAHAADPDRSVWHRAAALTGTDEQVAADLEVAAGRALRRGAPAASAAALEQAARLSDPTASRGHLLLRVGEIEIELGLTALALRHLAEAKPLRLVDAERRRLTLWLEAFNEDSWSGAARVAAFAEIANQMTNADEPALAFKPLQTLATGCWWETPLRKVAISSSLQRSGSRPRRTTPS